MINKKCFLPLLLFMFFLHGVVSAQNIRVAAAANLQSVIEVLQKDFKQRTGINVEPVVGSSGKLVAQISNGAPFDVFLSADMDFPQTLFKNGFAIKKPVVYARGSLIICSAQNIAFDNWERLLMTNKIKKIAIANPAIAPYGKAAEQLLKNKGILGEVKPKIVYGESISQVNTYITTQAVEVGFTTQSFIKDAEGKSVVYYKVMNTKDYEPILQGMVILKHGGDSAATEKFYQYILGPYARKIFQTYGYRAPQDKK